MNYFEKSKFLAWTLKFLLAIEVGVVICIQSPPRFSLFLGLGSKSTEWPGDAYFELIFTNNWNKI